MIDYTDPTSQEYEEARRAKRDAEIEAEYDAFMDSLESEEIEAEIEDDEIEEEIFVIIHTSPRGEWESSPMTFTRAFEKAQSIARVNGYSPVSQDWVGRRGIISQWGEQTIEFLLVK